MEVDFPGASSAQVEGSTTSRTSSTCRPCSSCRPRRASSSRSRAWRRRRTTVIIATDFDREGELIGADARDIVRSREPDVPVTRVRFSAITKDEIERAFAELGDDLARSSRRRASRGRTSTSIWGAVLTRYLTLAHQIKTRKPFGDVLSAGPRADADAQAHRGPREGARRVRARGLLGGARARSRTDGEEFAAAARHRPLQGRGGRRARCWTPSPAPTSGTRRPRSKRTQAQGRAARAVQHDVAHGGGRVRGPHPRADDARGRVALHERPHLATRASTTPSTRRASTSGRSCKTLAEVPVYREHAKRLLARAAQGDARRQGDDRPPADPPDRRGGPGEARRPGVEALQPRGAPLHGDAVRSRHRRGHERRHRRGRRALRREGRRGRWRRLPRHLPVRARRRTSTCRRWPRARPSSSSAPTMEAEADAAAGALLAGQAHPGDGEARPRHEGDPARHHPDAVRPQVRDERPDGADVQGHERHRARWRSTPSASPRRT